MWWDLLILESYEYIKAIYSKNGLEASETYFCECTYYCLKHLFFINKDNSLRLLIKKFIDKLYYTNREINKFIDEIYCKNKENDKNLSADNNELTCYIKKNNNDNIDVTADLHGLTKEDKEFEEIDLLFDDIDIDIDIEDEPISLDQENKPNLKNENNNTINLKQGNVLSSPKPFDIEWEELNNMLIISEKKSTECYYQFSFRYYKNEYDDYLVSISNSYNNKNKMYDSLQEICNNLEDTIKIVFLLEYVTIDLNLSYKKYVSQQGTYANLSISLYDVFCYIVNCKSFLSIDLLKYKECPTIDSEKCIDKACTGCPKMEAVKHIENKCSSCCKKDTQKCIKMTEFKRCYKESTNGITSACPKEEFNKFLGQYKVLLFLTIYIISYKNRGGSYKIMESFIGEFKKTVQKFMRSDIKVKKPLSNEVLRRAVAGLYYYGVKSKDIRWIFNCSAGYIFNCYTEFKDFNKSQTIHFGE